MYSLPLNQSIWKKKHSLANNIENIIYNRNDVICPLAIIHEVGIFFTVDDVLRILTVAWRSWNFLFNMALGF